MPRILILFGTTDGHTRKIAAGLAAAVREAGAEAHVVEARGAGRDVDPAPYDGVIVAASIHISAFQRPVRHWVRRHVAVLNRKPSAFICVCLGILEQRPEATREVHAIMDRFLVKAGWRPTLSQPVAGALAYTRYNPLVRWAMKRKVATISADTDTTRDYEYTDWEALRQLGLRFARMAGVPQPEPAGHH